MAKLRSVSAKQSEKSRCWFHIARDFRAFLDGDVPTHGFPGWEAESVTGDRTSNRSAWPFCGYLMFLPASGRLLCVPARRQTVAGLLSARDSRPGLAE